MSVCVCPKDPAPDDVNAEISGEYGDNISLSNRSIRIEPDVSFADFPNILFTEQ